MSEPVHGRYTTYGNHGCRCAECCAAYSLNVTEKPCDCGLVIWEFSDGTETLALTPIVHEEHPDDADNEAWQSWYLRHLMQMEDFYASFRARLEELGVPA